MGIIKQVMAAIGGRRYELRNMSPKELHKALTYDDMVTELRRNIHFDENRVKSFLKDCMLARPDLTCQLMVGLDLSQHEKHKLYENVGCGWRCDSNANHAWWETNHMLRQQRAEELPPMVRESLDWFSQVHGW